MCWRNIDGEKEKYEIFDMCVLNLLKKKINREIFLPTLKSFPTTNFPFFFFSIFTLILVVFFLPKHDEHTGKKKQKICVTRAQIGKRNISRVVFFVGWKISMFFLNWFNVVFFYQNFSNKYHSKNITRLNFFF